jgi:serine/threonine protein phosphatase PrpC
MSDSKLFYYCNVEGNTDVGCKRKANEDWYAHFECQNGLVSVVCDGMGGHVGGAVASHLAVDTIQEFLKHNYFDDPRQAIVDACNAANNAILNRTQAQPELTGMGATCVMLIVRDGKVYIGCIGDSRIYIIRDHKITQLTKDQSYVQLLVDAQEITKEQAEHHPRKNEILNALGLPTMKPATVHEDAIIPSAGDIFLLCSDGLSGMVSDREILKIAGNQTQMTQRERVDTLIQKARANGGLDNITCVIVEFSVTPKTQSGDHRSVFNKNSILRYVLPSVLALVVVFFGILQLMRSCSEEDEQKSETREFLDNLGQKEKAKRYDIGKCILFAKDKVVFSMQILAGLGGYVFIDDGGTVNDTISIKGRINIDSVSVKPEGSLELEKNGNEIICKFRGDSFKEEQIILSVLADDSTFIYVFPVALPSSGRNSSEALPQDKKSKEKGGILGMFGFGEKLSRAASTDEKGGDSSSKNSDTETSAPKAADGEEGTENTSSTPEGSTANVEEEEYEYTITVEKDVFELTLIADKPTNEPNTNHLIHTCLGFGTLQDTDWFKCLMNNGKNCKIKIIKEKIPDDNADIKIPIINHSGKYYTIHIKRK